MRILFGVAGGIAAYKAVQAVRLLVKAGHDVHVVPTANALRFVGLPTWEAISRNPVSTELFDEVSRVRHVSIGEQADLVVVAPATADLIARAVQGQADDLLTSSLLVAEAPVIFVPAMHSQMWRHPATQANIQSLRDRGVSILGPDVGQLTGDDQGIGRMVEPEIIAEAVERSLRPKDLVGRTIVISAGGTRERVDPVRFLGNDSSGKQGVAIAEEALARGAEVIIVAGHLDVHTPRGAEVIKARYTESMRQAIESLADEADCIIMAAAIADYRPADPASAKLKKAQEGSELNLRLIANPDILSEISHRSGRSNLIVGFAAETASGERLLELGRAKIERKGCDLLVVNEVGEGKTFGFDDTDVTILDAKGQIVAEVNGPKREVAEVLMNQVALSI
ncbi:MULTISPECIES: bifunctional phosphopantothenoylcysteine decarboxylase/phosphopantothenate--cysteine ligase CoaBC [unclassified Pseudoclavibacter]|uniref:bifunctional phosphopantothenoylcysteine decarboxylase/phosphopantothenate--cysteine ligase CoaBC n=1 Tax=unclassified Pseudoclavibacter TaxID=2615177 RepID=UPI0013012632|nr:MULTISPECIES: bifunctional phosphopantothenoylcysteine decarboxylase/phosphopantothenate--cysteine ligase CoaBC [unclassified Pseudoclavibacter]KAB1646408.1 bifunctional phosphopantothenoylcysteine decarboxylase/phosphopantothenate--cysteine ligase CoaBC [Pseudoclavibacter sp. CFCC 14310]KAB1663432.1 bifunctional phosphopantothenoylcysteine decarboxylase/phosphopantothenate--cysteine ligase CoaBC [Pseudoclavibacter sp. CFCC 13611]